MIQIHYTPQEQYIIKQFVKRARIEDEPFAIKVFEWFGWRAEQGNKYEDWLHIDIHTYRDDKYVKVDVKRNSKHYKTGDNFTFTIRNGKSQEFPFEAGADFAFIDEITNTIMLVDQKVFENRFGNYQRHIGKINPNSRYIIIKKYELRQICHTEIKNIPQNILNILK